MKYLALILFTALIPAHAQLTNAAASVPGGSLNVGKGRIALGTFTTLERRFDDEFRKIGEADNPIEMLGASRGVHLDGYGVVFTTELSLVLAPGTSPFMPTIPKEVVARTRQRKLDRLPVLRQKIRELMRVAALTLIQIPDGQQLVIAVRLDYRQWEDTSGLPGQILMRASVKSARLGEDIATEEQ